MYDKETEATVLVLLFFLGAVGCGGPPGRSSPRGEAVEAAHMPVLVDGIGGVGYFVDAQRALRRADGSMITRLPADALVSPDGTLRAVGLDAVWFTDGTVLSALSDGAWTEHAPQAVTAAPDGQPVFESLDARAPDDAWVTMSLLEVPEGEDRQICHWDGMVWTCEALPPSGFGGPSTVVATEGAIFVETPDGIFRRDAGGSLIPIAAPAGVQSLAQLRPLADDTATAVMLDDRLHVVADYAIADDGSITEIQLPAFGASRTASAEDNAAWLLTYDFERDIECGFVSPCIATAYWRQYVVWRWDGSTTTEIAHVSRTGELEDISFDIQIVPDGDRVWLYTEGETFTLGGS